METKIEEKLIKLNEKINLSFNKVEKDKYHLVIQDDHSLDLIIIDKKVYLISRICALKEEKKEVILTHVMKGNLLQKGTGRGIIGIDKEEKFLTLTYKIDYEEILEDFNNILEEYINYLIFWEKELSELLKLKSIY